MKKIFLILAVAFLLGQPTAQAMVSETSELTLQTIVQISLDNVAGQIRNDHSEFLALTPACKLLRRRIKRKKCSFEREDINTKEEQKTCVLGVLAVRDADNDCIPKRKDNCDDVSNFEQIDTDNDDIGNACDTNDLSDAA